MFHRMAATSSSPARPDVPKASQMEDDISSMAEDDPIMMLFSPSNSTETTKDNTSRDLKDAEIYYSKAKDFVNKNRELQSASKQMTEQMEALLKASEQLISPSPSSSVDLT
ncbi:hypothetical protein EB796_002967 [Bugula neritina]|uniref:Uncharacterized protein n=1 Tax=Bugula neritina TaxID=10212 RepID=A0A7J7KJ47_BUGNE|nr:hypothetical protein EB796_002967 [Bugula neritina]